MPLDDFEVGDRARGARAAPRPKSKIFCGCVDRRSAAEPNTPHLIRCAWACRASLPVLNRRGGRAGGARWGSRSGCEVSARASGSRARTTSTRTCPRAIRSRSTTLPICEGGDGARSACTARRARCALTRIHLEEDAGKNVHDGGADGSSGSTSTAPASRWSRSSASPTCAPPTRRSSTCASLRAHPACTSASNDGNMEEGSLRCDANVSRAAARRDRARHSAARSRT